MIVYANKKFENLTSILISLHASSTFLLMHRNIYWVKISDCLEGHKVNVLLPSFKSKLVTANSCM